MTFLKLSQNDTDFFKHKFVFFHVQGDSGSPLVHQYSRELIGIASFISGHGCESGAPQAFTKVYKYQNWIADVTGLKLPHCDAHEDDYFHDYLINDELDMYC